MVVVKIFSVANSSIEPNIIQLGRFECGKIDRLLGCTDLRIVKRISLRANTAMHEEQSTETCLLSSEHRVVVLMIQFVAFPARTAKFE